MRIGRPNTGVTVRAGYDANGAGCDIPWTLSDKVAMLGVRTETGVVKLLEMMCRDDGRIICLERHGILVGADGESVHLEPHRPSVLIAGSLDRKIDTNGRVFLFEFESQLARARC